MDYGKVSIVIPIYNTEKYLRRCIESVVRQSYRNLQIIFVNDCSPGNAEEIVKEYQFNDDRIVLVSHEKNKGLFQARVTGASVADGDYIAFLDSDDYISLDYYRVMLKKASETNSDIVIGQTVFEKVDHTRVVRNLHDACFSFDVISGADVQNAFFDQQGQCYSWHTVWNKVYRMDLWKQCEPYYREINGHVIMTEDIAFSSPLFYFAASIATVHQEAVFYCENEGASTNTTQIKFPRFKKNLTDITTVFNFVEAFLKKQNAGQKIRQDFFEFRKYYARMWYELGTAVFLGAERKDAEQLLHNFLPEYKEITKPIDHFFESIETPWRGQIEEIKENILKIPAEYISFDIFDTVVVRPFYTPTDLFKLLDQKFETIYSGNISFSDIRVQGEAETRRRIGYKNSAFQDVTIDEIYETIQDFFNLPPEVTDAMEKEEKRLELLFCTPRHAVIEIFEFVKQIGKKLVFISDMYLDRETVTSILEKNGLNGYERLFLSSEERLTKHSGDLFRAVLHELDIKANQLIHLGDTWENDIVKPQRLGIHTFFIPKAKEVFENHIQNLQTNSLRTIGDKVCGSICNVGAMHKSIGFNAMQAMAANSYFDNPYRAFHAESDFNADPYLIGFYALGMHLVGLNEWIASQTHGYETVAFLSRDGYLPMKAYQIACRYCKELPQAEYLYSSRKALLPEMIVTENDLYDIPVEYHNHTPRTVLDLLSFCTKECTDKQLKNDGFIAHKTFATRMEFNQFVRYVIEKLYDFESHKQSSDLVKRYYAERISDKTIAFDMGYSGRIQAAISRAVGHGIDVLFVHGDSKRLAEVSRKYHFEARCFYDFSPNMTGLIREHILSDLAGSCIGFSEETGEITPVLESQRKTVHDLFIIQTMQRGALDFVEQWYENFGAFEDYIPFKAHEVAMPFEGFLRCARDVDMRVFSASYFEDLVYGARDQINVYRFIRDERNCLPDAMNELEQFDQSATIERLVFHRSKCLKVFMYALFDRKLLKEKVRNKLNNHPKMLALSKRMYRCAKRLVGRG
nr:HAD-IA family hydrolase [uncultured Agathobaculum sp.]